MTPKVIDAHIHVTKFSEMKTEALEYMMTNLFFKENWRKLELMPKFLIDIMVEENVEKAVLINYVAPSVIGFTESVNEFVSNYAKEYPDMLIPFGGIDVKRHTREDIKNILEELYSRYEVKGIKLHPVHQLFYVNQYVDDYGSSKLEQLKVLYEFCEDRGIPVTVHTGTSMFPGARIRYGNPIYLDDVAVDFPRLKIIMAHGGRPIWMSTAFYLLRRHRSNMFLDISGIPPQRLLEYFPRLTEIAHKIIFGSDWPSPGVKGMRKNAELIMQLPIDNEIKDSILYRNFRQLL
ncbi:MAG TPA: amidohydrolase [Candidatus Caldiarchaeum subterraneum]|uniref:Amidohydrolase n=1 Tax=Caldiarchaeum subterraneum TaxID=311458 RepID=A0A832ZWU7_CALS0|nr:amidohydrolase [Candidatus Caldarchaeum subterraneum]